MNIFEVIDETKGGLRLTQTSGYDLINYWVSNHCYHFVSVRLENKKYLEWNLTLYELNC